MKYRVKSLFIFFISALLTGYTGNFYILKASIIETSDNQQVLDENNKVVDENISSIKNDSYILGPGDTLEIKFVGVNELSGNYLIMRDGNIQLPLLGSKNIVGLTLTTARQRLIELYQQDLIRPEIDLTLANARPVRVSLIGEVQRPGSYTFNRSGGSQVKNSSGAGTSSLGYQTVVDAIQKAGGLTFDADITKVTLFRKLPINEGGMKKTTLDLLKMIKTGNQSNNPIIFDGDIIEISKTTNNITKLENIPNNLTPETIKIHVIGEVASPGIMQVDSKTQLSQAILMAGGPNSWRYKDKVQLLRIKRNGAVEVQKVSFNKQGISKNSNQIALRDGDIIRVHKNLFSKSTDSIRTLLPPIRDIYTLYGVYKLIE